MDRDKKFVNCTSFLCYLVQSTVLMSHALYYFIRVESCQSSPEVSVIVVELISNVDWDITSFFEYLQYFLVCWGHFVQQFKLFTCSFLFHSYSYLRVLYIKTFRDTGVVTPQPATYLNTLVARYECQQ